MSAPARGPVKLGTQEALGRIRPEGVRSQGRYVSTVRKVPYCPHFGDEEAEAQEGATPAPGPTAGEQ